MKKVTLQEIANSLGISRTTVWKVFSGQDGVSPHLKGKIIAKAQEMNYSFPESFLYSQQESFSDAPTNIAVAVCRPESSIFWMTIIHHIAKELSSQNVNLIYTYLPSCIDEDSVLPAHLVNGGAHGMIVMNVYNEELIRLLALAPIPKVFLDTSTSVSFKELNGDLLLMENRISISSITEHLIKQGRTELGFVGDINYATSNKERFDGFLQTLKNYQLAFNPELSLTSSIGIDTYKEEIDLFLDQLPHLPGAFVCASDHVACLIMQLLLKRGHRIPDDIAVSGFDGNMENPLAEDLTTVQVFNQDIGLRLAYQILYRIKHPDAKHEVTYIDSEVIFRGSTGDTGGGK